MLKKLGFSKGLKNIVIDSESHIIYKNTNLKLVVLRPNDLAQMGDLIGQGNKDIITWIGKTVGRNFAEAVDQVDNPKNNLDFITKCCKALEYTGFGQISIVDYSDKQSAKIEIKKPLYENLEENQDIISTIYLGVFLGIFEHLGLVASGSEVISGWKDENVDYSLFEFNFSEGEQ
ncbi:MAG: hypothetical protein ACTSVY_08985 [Candidatus Helarchaeota archaeon]